MGAVFATLWLALAAPAPDTRFVAEAARGIQGRIDLGMIGHIRAADRDVVALTTAIVRDEAQAQERLQAAAARAGVPFPAPAASSTTDTVETLSALRTNDVDPILLSRLETSLEAALADYEAGLRSGLSPPLEAWTRERIPALRRFLAAVQALRAP